MVSPRLITVTSQWEMTFRKATAKYLHSIKKEPFNLSEFCFLYKNKGEGFYRFLLKYWNGKFRCIGTLMSLTGHQLYMYMKRNRVMKKLIGILVYFFILIFYPSSILYAYVFCLCSYYFHVKWTFSFCFSSKMAAAAVKEVCREKKIWICRGTERGYASRTCEKNHQRSWRHDKPKIQT